jgi:hypothetical protein
LLDDEDEFTGGVVPKVGFFFGMAPNFRFGGSLGVSPPFAASFAPVARGAGVDDEEVTGLLSSLIVIGLSSFVAFFFGIFVLRIPFPFRTTPEAGVDLCLSFDFSFTDGGESSSHSSSFSAAGASCEALYSSAESLSEDTTGRFNVRRCGREEDASAAGVNFFAEVLSWDFGCEEATVEGEPPPSMSTSMSSTGESGRDLAASEGVSSTDDVSSKTARSRFGLVVLAALFGAGTSSSSSFSARRLLSDGFLERGGKT